jgi:hypothetical protein
MGVGLGVNDVPIVGEPVAYGIGFGVLLLVGFSQLTQRYFLTFAHEGGHVLATLFTFRKYDGFEIDDLSGGKTNLRPLRWRISTPIIFFFGYPAASLFGLGAAVLVALGNPFAVLLISALAGLLGVLAGANGLARLISGLVLVGSGWALLAASPELQAGIAVGITWFLLISGLADLLDLRRLADTVDAKALASMTLVPRAVWALIWVFIGVVALIVGGQLLLRPGYGIG